MADEYIHAASHKTAPAATGHQPAGQSHAGATVAEHGAPAAAAHEEHGHGHVPVVLQPPTPSDEAMAVLEPPIKRWRYLLLALLVLALLGVLVIAGPLNFDVRLALR
jgi:hypothetical protein